jgi:hypothetical protein
MNRKQLIESTYGLATISIDSLNEYKLNQETLVAMMNTRMEGQPDIADLVGGDNLSLMKENHANHAIFMESMFALCNTEVLVDTIIWVFRVYRAREFKVSYWVKQLNSWIELYQATLTARCFNEILPFYEWMLIHVPDFSLLSDETTVKNGHLKE